MINWIKVNRSNVLIGSIIIIVFMYFYVSSSEEQEVIDQSNEIFESEQQESKEINDQQMIEKDVVILVDIKGAVKQPGVYKAALGDRVNDVILRAGGLLENADQRNVNLALKVVDEMIIYVPAIGEVIEGMNTSPTTGESESKGKVNINTADETALQTLTGIGSSKALAIIDYRDTNGPFKSIDDLKNISGIGDKTFEKLKDQIYQIIRIDD